MLKLRLESQVGQKEAYQAKTKITSPVKEYYGLEKKLEDEKTTDGDHYLGGQ